MKIIHTEEMFARKQLNNLVSRRLTEYQNDYFKCFGMYPPDKEEAEVLEINEYREELLEQMIEDK